MLVISLASETKLQVFDCIFIAYYVQGFAFLTCRNENCRVGFSFHKLGIKNCM